jgi:NAD(P)-dependent dehydrogenase (short-subunit alcohol dehydrogenase family)
MRLENRIAVVTGGSSGIGEACAELFAVEGARVAVLDREIDSRSPHFGLRCDVSDDADVEQAFAQVASRFGRVDILLNSAGIAMRKPVADEDVATWDRSFEVNVRGTFLASKYALAHMPDGGSIVHVSSVTGITGVRNRAAYSATKGAIVALTRNMAMDLAARRIRVNCICPGFIKTPLLAALLEDPDRTARITAMHPLGRLGTTEDVARAVLFIASDHAAWITGTTLVVDGGLTAGQRDDI